MTATLPLLAAFSGYSIHAIAQAGQKIGVIATLSTTLDPTIDLVRRRAQAQNKTPDIISHLCEGAFEAVRSGDTDTHDHIVTEGLRQLISQVDVIVLAQASMARVVDTLSDTEKTVPILSSPRSGVKAARSVIKNL